MSTTYHIAAFYKFFPIAETDIATTQAELKQYGDSLGIKGLVLVATEGINGTVCGSPEAITSWKEKIRSIAGDLYFNDSEADRMVFPRFLVKIRQEIVALKQDDVHPMGQHRHLAPADWDAMMQEEDVVIIDTRNTYETEIGMFENAIDPKLATFSEFADYVEKADIPKDKKVMMYCTGGIRCEKAIYEMEKRGYTNVYQLKGGILSYMKEFPEGKFKGECFVFDHRVSVGKNLEPSKRYGLCPFCGDPADQPIDCECCLKRSRVCHRCLKNDENHFCSKSCKSALIKR